MEPCTVTFHLNTMNSETELKEHEIITDFIEGGEDSRYSITHVKDEDLSVNIHAIEGDIEVTFTNFAQVSLLKSTEPGRKTWPPSSGSRAGFTIHCTTSSSSGPLKPFGMDRFSP